MRMFLFPVVAAASALAFAAPASAQWYPQPRGYAHGYYDLGAARSMDARVEGVRRHVFAMHQRRLLTPSQARSFDRQAIAIKQRIRSASRNGLRLSERRSIDRRIHRLEQRVQVRVARNARYGSRYAYGRAW